LLTAHELIYQDGHPPYIYFQSENRLFYLVVPEFYLIGPDNIQIYVNNQLYYYVSGFPSKDVTIGGQLFKQIIFYDIADDGFQYQPPVKTNNYGGRWTTGGYARKVAAEYRTDYKFNWLLSVMVTSNLPIRQEILPMRTGLVFQNLNNPVSYINTLPILQDFRPDVNEFGLQNSTLIYAPDSEFRWIDIYNDTPIDRFSFNFMWMSSDQNTHQLYLNPGQSGSLKLYFKSIY
jgi:hypothetical protein